MVITAGRVPMAVGRMDRGRVHVAGRRSWEAGGNTDAGQPPGFQIQLGSFQEGTEVTSGVSSIEFNCFNVYLLFLKSSFCCARSAAREIVRCDA